MPGTRPSGKTGKDENRYNRDEDGKEYNIDPFAGQTNGGEKSPRLFYKFTTIMMYAHNVQTLL
jgi:hypothetical protein